MSGGYASCILKITLGVNENQTRNLDLSTQLKIYTLRVMSYTLLLPTI